MRRKFYLTEEQEQLKNGFMQYEIKRGIRNMQNGIYQLARFFEYVNQRGLDVLRLSNKEAEGFLQHLADEVKNKQLKRLSARVHVVIAKRLYNYLEASGKVKSNPFSEEEKTARLWKEYRVDGYIAEQKKRGLRKLERLTKSIRRLFVYLSEAGLKADEMQAETYRDWLKGFKMGSGRMYKEGCIRDFMDVGRHFYEYLVREKLVSVNPLLVLKKQESSEEKEPGKYADLVKGFENYLLLDGRRKRTIEGLIYNIKTLFEYLEEKGLEFMEVKAAAAQGFQGWIMARGEQKQGFYDERTVTNYMTLGVKFFDYLKDKKLVHSNPFREIRRVRGRRKLPKDVLKEEEMQRLLNAFAEFDAEDNLLVAAHTYKLHVLAELLYSTGMRINEAAGLRVEDVDFKNSLVVIRETKEKQERVAFLNRYAKEILRIYVKELRPVLISVLGDKSNLFGANARVLPQTFNRELAKVCWKARLVPVTSKGFRHAFGYHFLRAGCDMRYIQALLGHRQLTSTEKYTKVDKESLREVIDKYHPRQWR